MGVRARRQIWLLPFFMYTTCKHIPKKLQKLNWLCLTSAGCMSVKRSTDAAPGLGCMGIFTGLEDFVNTVSHNKNVDNFTACCQFSSLLFSVSCWNNTSLHCPIFSVWCSSPDFIEHAVSTCRRVYLFSGKTIQAECCTCENALAYRRFSWQFYCFPLALWIMLSPGCHVVDDVHSSYAFFCTIPSSVQSGLLSDSFSLEWLMFD